MNALQILRCMKEEEARAGLPVNANRGLRLVPDHATSGRLLDVGGSTSDCGAEPDPWSEVWVPTAFSTGTRQPTPRSKGHSRGWVVDPAANRAIGFSSTHEMRLAAMLLANRNVVEVEDQPAAVSYRGADGKRHHHTFDYRATYRNGRRVAIAVKPRSAVVKSGIRDVLKRVRPVLGSFAHEAVLLTDTQITMARGRNALSILRARRARNEEDCARMRNLFRRVHGSVHADHIAEQFGNRAAGKNAIWCLIYDGFLQLAEPDRKFIDAPFVAKVATVG
ncbi:hypothetical protein PWG15_27005 (plasmid) [Ensifer adhaerens]|uniref:hypothetical protein n=1 Tax=Ensifer adhaerens TaxID=106592 RepID=UPI0023A9CF18|nr:hypothetical protein [Ensifer adhaerens]WDZ79134.1 hypothetical protein PWG15_27005 [Ensifer adhaerens]